MALMTCQNICKTYNEGAGELNVLNDVSFSVNAGEKVAIVGSSGSGKSTLLHLLGALDKPTSGKVLFEGDDIYAFNEKQQANFRNQHLGFVYQQHHLLPEFNALENVAMPLFIAKTNKKQALQKAQGLLQMVGLEQRAAHLPNELSGGERQRVAIARALVNDPTLVLADEPTGNLDDAAGEDIYQLLLSLQLKLKTSFVVVTHDTRLAARLDRTLVLKQGKLHSEA